MRSMVQKTKTIQMMLVEDNWIQDSDLKALWCGRISSYSEGRYEEGVELRVRTSQKASACLALPWSLIWLFPRECNQPGEILVNKHCNNKVITLNHLTFCFWFLVPDTWWTAGTKWVAFHRTDKNIFGLIKGTLNWILWWCEKENCDVRNSDEALHSIEESGYVFFF